jgi:hypothetical protein
LPLVAWLTWIADHIGLGSIKNVTGVRKDLVDTKKAKLEIDKLEDEAEKRDSLITPATFEDVKNYDPKYKQINEKLFAIDQIERKLLEATKVIVLVLFIIGEIYIHLFALIRLIIHFFRQ